MMAKRRNDEDEHAIRRHFDSSLKTALSCSLAAEGFVRLSSDGQFSHTDGSDKYGSPFCELLNQGMTSASSD